MRLFSLPNRITGRRPERGKRHWKQIKGANGLSRECPSPVMRARKMRLFSLPNRITGRRAERGKRHWNKSSARMDYPGSALDLFGIVLTMAKPPVVAIVNTNPDLVELLKLRIEAAGFIVLVMHVADIRGGLDVNAMLGQHDPQVIVYDVVAPYVRNWRFLQHLRSTTFRDRRFVLTAPNEQALRRIVGRDEAIYEILEDGADIDDIVQAVREAARARPTR